MLEFLRMASSCDRRFKLFPRFKRNPGDPRERSRPREYSGHDGCGRGHFRAADRTVSDLPQEDHGRRFERRYQGMMDIKRKKALTSILIIILIKQRV